MSVEPGDRRYFFFAWAFAWVPMFAAALIKVLLWITFGPPSADRRSDVGVMILSAILLLAAIIHTWASGRRGRGIFITLNGATLLAILWWLFMARFFSGGFYK